MLAINRDLHALPAKFAFLIDDGSGLSLGSVPADIRFDWTGGPQPFAIGIGGQANDVIVLGRCAGIDIPHVAMRLARAFLRLVIAMAEPPRRMRGLIARCGGHIIANETGLCLTGATKRGAIENPCPIGLMRFNDKYCFGAGAAFGFLDATMLDAAADAAEIFGVGEIRLTPWRALIVTDVAERQADAIKAYFTGHHFIVDRKDSRLAVVACGGATTCEHGTTDSRSDALTLMASARRLAKTGVALHVSGCAKGCAWQTPAPLTLIAHEKLYDLITGPAARAAGINDVRRLSLAAVHDYLRAIA